MHPYRLPSDDVVSKILICSARGVCMKGVIMSEASRAIHIKFFVVVTKTGMFVVI